MADKVVLTPWLRDRIDYLLSKRAPEPTPPCSCNLPWGCDLCHPNKEKE